MQRCTETRRRASAPGISESRSNVRALRPAAHIASIPPAITSACRHDHGSWHRACSVVPKRAGEHPRRAFRRVDPSVGALRPEESRPGCQRGHRGQLRGLCRGPVQLSESLVRLCALADGASRVVHPHPATNGNLGTARSASERAELRRSTRENVRAWCSRTISYARCWRSVAKSQ